MFYNRGGGVPPTYAWEGPTAAYKRKYGCRVYYKTDTDSYNVASGSGFYSFYGRDYTFWVSKIEIRDTGEADTQVYAIHVTDDGTIDLAGIDTIHSCSIDCDHPGSANLYFAVSWDDGVTFKIWDATGETWAPIVRNNSGTWQYRSAAGPTWTNATANTEDQAMIDAVGVAINQWEEADIEAMDEDDWGATGGFDSIDTFSAKWAFAMQAASGAKPAVRKITMTTTGAGQTQVQAWKNGAWDSENWTDGTAVDSVTLAKSGIVSYNGTGDYSEADYAVIDSVPGYWWRLQSSHGTSLGTAIRRVLCQQPVQPLQNIGSGFKQPPLTFVDEYNGIFRDLTWLVSDYSESEASAVDLSYRDVKGTIDRWVQDSGAEGHFENASGSAVSITSTGTESDVDEGCFVAWSGGGDLIKTVTNDGDASSEVDLYADPGGSKLLTGIYTNKSPDAIYINNGTRFTEVEFAPVVANTAAVTITWYYWNGVGWTLLSVQDETVVDGKVFSTKGSIKFALPSGWKKSRLLSGRYGAGYALKGVPSGDLSSGVKIAEIRVSPVPEDIAKYQYAVTFNDRLALGGRPDALDQVNLSRPLEHFGFSEDNSYGFRTGRYNILGMVEAWGKLLLPKPDGLYVISESGGALRQDQLEVGQVPVNHQCIIKAPMSGMEDRYDVSRQGIFFLSGTGAYVYTGLQADGTFATGRVQEISREVDWWESDAEPRIDKTNLHLACGAFDETRNWLIWAVPMITSGSSPQTTNNRLIIFDLSLGAWCAPASIAASALHQATHYNANAVGKLSAEKAVYAGTYDGHILQLFRGTQDDSADITASAKSGHIHFGSPGIEKVLGQITIWGQTSGASVTLKIYKDGETTATETITCDNFSGLTNHTFKHSKVPGNGVGSVFFEFLQYELEWTGPTNIWGIQVDVTSYRDYIGGDTQ